MKKPHVDTTSAFVVASVSVCFQNQLEVCPVFLFPLLSESSCFKIVIITAPGDACYFAQHADIQEIPVSLCHLPDDAVLG